MNQRLTPATIALLVIPPLMWAGNAVVGRMVNPLVPPITLNFLRWALAFVILLPLAGHVLRTGSPLWPLWRRFAVLGLLGVGAYNALQYLALQTSTPINVTLVAASMPIWLLGIGGLFFGVSISRRQVLGAVLSLAGVLVVLSRGDWQQLMQVRLVPGDIYILLATIAWSFYSWLLIRPQEPPALRNDWAAFLMAQIVFGLVWSGLFAGGEWALTGCAHPVGLAAGCGVAVHCRGAGAAGLLFLGHGREARGAHGGGLLRQPHAAVCRRAVGGLSG